MPQTLANLVSDIQNAHASRGDLSTAEIYRHISYAIQRIANLKDWRELNGLIERAWTSASTSPLDITDGVIAHTRVKSILQISYESDNSPETYAGRLKPVNSIAQWNEALRERNNSARAEPSHYFWFSHDKILITPLANEDYTLTIWINLWPLDVTSADSATTLTLLGTDALTVALANALLFARFRSENGYAQWIRIYQDELIAFMESHKEDKDFDMAAIRQEHSGAGGTYWSDPFVRNMPGSQV